MSSGWVVRSATTGRVLFDTRRLNRRKNKDNEPAGPPQVLYVTPVQVAFGLALMPFLVVTLMHVVYATMYPVRYNAVCITFIFLNAMCLIPYVSWIAFLVLFVWLIVLFAAAGSVGGKRKPRIVGGGTARTTNAFDDIPPSEATSFLDNGEEDVLPDILSMSFDNQSMMSMSSINSIVTLPDMYAGGGPNAVY